MVDNSAPLTQFTGQLRVPTTLAAAVRAVIGDRLYTSYHTLVNAGGAALLAKVQPYFARPPHGSWHRRISAVSAAALRADVAVQRIAVCA